mmetsp:Transcript_110885/g.264519  ORF Transcript_110885/g.264519 Transcript_110885/m.264519 type:complete len:294 (+) Transcript_110885:1921-2802(+)
MSSSPRHTDKPRGSFSLAAVPTWPSPQTSPKLNGGTQLPATKSPTMVLTVPFSKEACLTRCGSDQKSVWPSSLRAIPETAPTSVLYRSSQSSVLPKGALPSPATVRISPVTTAKPTKKVKSVPPLQLNMPLHQHTLKKPILRNSTPLQISSSLESTSGSPYGRVRSTRDASMPSAAGVPQRMEGCTTRIWSWRIIPTPSTRMSSGRPIAPKYSFTSLGPLMTTSISQIASLAFSVFGAPMKRYRPPAKQFTAVTPTVCSTMLLAHTGLSFQLLFSPKRICRPDMVNWRSSVRG